MGRRAALNAGFEDASAAPFGSGRRGATDCMRHISTQRRPRPSDRPRGRRGRTRGRARVRFPLFRVRPRPSLPSALSAAAALGRAESGAELEGRRRRKGEMTMSLSGGASKRERDRRPLKRRTADAPPPTEGDVFPMIHFSMTPCNILRKISTLSDIFHGTVIEK